MIQNRQKIMASVVSRLKVVAGEKDDRPAPDLPISDSGESTILHKVMQSGIQIDGNPAVDVDGEETVVTVIFKDHAPDNIIDQLNDVLGKGKELPDSREVMWKIGNERAVFNTAQDAGKSFDDFELVIYTK